MLDINFAKQPVALAISVAGVEFMDYQSPDFYKKLVALLETFITVDKDGGYTLESTRNSENSFSDLIMEYTGMCIKVNIGTEVANAAMESGYFTPGNLMNIPGIEYWIEKEESTIGRAFKTLKTDCIKGWVDTSTGRVGGDFSKIEVTMYINQYLQTFIDAKIIQKHKVSMAEAIAGIMLHELGHCFTGFLYCFRTVVDPLMTYHAVKLITKGRLYGKERLAIVKETMQMLECTDRVDESAISNMEAPELMTYFDKAIANRDTRRTLSLGTQSRASEVYADLYAIRFGASKTMIAALAALPKYTVPASYLIAMTGMTIFALAALQPVVAILGAANVIWFSLLRQHLLINPNETYDSPYRRVKNILRDQIVRINNDKSISSKEKARMLADAKKMEKIADEAKPFLEGTGFQRFLGWLFSGSDFKAQEFEHYTEEMLAHTLSLYKDTFKD